MSISPRSLPFAVAAGLAVFAPAFALADTLCRNADPKHTLLVQKQYLLMDTIDSPVVTFYVDASKPQCAPCLRAYHEQLVALRDRLQTIDRPQSKRALADVVVQLGFATSRVHRDCHITSAPKKLERQIDCKRWPQSVRVLKNQIVLTQASPYPFAAHQLLFWQFGELSRACRLDR